MLKRRIACGMISCILVFGLLPFVCAAEVDSPAVTADLLSQLEDISGHWGTESIAFAVSRGLMVGMSETTFEPDRAVNWAMVVTVFGRMELGAVKPEDCVWYSPFVTWAVGNGLMSAGQDPLEPISRECLAEFLSGFLHLTGAQQEVTLSLPYEDRNSIDPELWYSVAYVSGAGLLQGREDGNFAPKDMLTRAELSVLLQRVSEWSAAD